MINVKIENKFDDGLIVSYSSKEDGITYVGALVKQTEVFYLSSGKPVMRSGISDVSNLLAGRTEEDCDTSFPDALVLPDQAKPNDHNQLRNIYTVVQDAPIDPCESFPLSGFCRSSKSQAYQRIKKTKKRPTTTFNKRRRCKVVQSLKPTVLKPTAPNVVKRQSSPPPTNSNTNKLPIISKKIKPFSLKLSKVIVK